MSTLTVRLAAIRRRRFRWLRAEREHFGRFVVVAVAVAFDRTVAECLCFVEKNVVRLCDESEAIVFRALVKRALPK